MIWKEQARADWPAERSRKSLGFILLEDPTKVEKTMTYTEGGKIQAQTAAAFAGNFAAFAEAIPWT